MIRFLSMGSKRLKNKSTDFFDGAFSAAGWPVLCPTHHYCPEGSTQPLPCPPAHICKGQDVVALAQGSWKDLAAVAAGYYHSAAITDSGELWTWGHNQHGQLGVGDIAKCWGHCKSTCPNQGERERPEGRCRGCWRFSHCCNHRLRRAADLGPQPRWPAWRWGHCRSTYPSQGDTTQFITATSRNSACKVRGRSCAFLPVSQRRFQCLHRVGGSLCGRHLGLQSLHPAVVPCFTLAVSGFLVAAKLPAPRGSLGGNNLSSRLLLHRHLPGGLPRRLLLHLGAIVRTLCGFEKCSESVRMPSKLPTQ